MLHICHIISGDLREGAEAMAYHLLKGLMMYGDIEAIKVIAQ